MNKMKNIIYQKFKNFIFVKIYMPCIYKYDRYTPDIISFENKTLSADGKVEYYSYLGEHNLIGNPNHIFMFKGDALRYVDTTENFYAQETYTIVKKGSDSKGKIVDTVLHIANMITTIDSEGFTLDGTYKSCPDKATINFNNTTGIRTLTFN
jgi:hypothetical protein